MTRHRITAFAGAFLFLSATLAACGGSGTGTGPEPAATAAPAPTQTQAAAPAAPKFLMVLGDTVRGTAGLSDEEKAALTCVAFSKFPHGGRIVWRIRVFDPLTNKAMDDKSLQYVRLSLPDGKTQDLKYGPHGGTKEAPADFFWVTGWTVPADYPTGVFNYKVEAKSLEGAVGTFGYDYFKVTSGQLTIVPAPFPKK
ncbi:MAG TPA: hypothetical protein VFM93_10150 [Candidatus Limnocylindria bacterium]|nr:hypothetical protein [Candidatus Limnocylindria bacterium]